MNEFAFSLDDKLRTLADEEPCAPTTEYRVHALARAAGTTVRNLRAYQDRGLLPPPERRGRVGIYNGEHLARLRQIGQLLARGYSLASIRDLLDAWNQGSDLAQLLGLEQVIAGAWQRMEPLRLELDEARSLFGAELDGTNLEHARELGLIEFAGDHFRVLDPRVFSAGVQLLRAGIPLATLLELFTVIRRQVEPVAAGIVQMIVRHLITPLFTDSLPHARELEALNNRLLALRPLVEQVVDSELARGLQSCANQELDERVGALLKSFLKP